MSRGRAIAGSALTALCLLWLYAFGQAAFGWPVWR